MSTAVIMNDTLDLKDLNVYLALYDEVIIPGWLLLKMAPANYQPHIYGAPVGLNLFNEYSELGLANPPVLASAEHTETLRYFMSEARYGRLADFPAWVDKVGQRYLRTFQNNAFRMPEIERNLDAPRARSMQATFTNATVLFYTHYLSSINQGKNYRPVLKPGGNMFNEDPSCTALRLLMGDILLPTPSTPVQAILDFRKDAEVQEHLLAFRSFARRLDRMNYLAAEINEEYELKRLQYNRYIERQKLDFKKQRIDLLLSYPVTIIHDLLKLDFPGAVRKVLRLRECLSYKRPSLSVGDPGYELAIIGDFENLRELESGQVEQGGW
jgi:hypothetical protein